MVFDPEIHRRRSIPYKGHDYSQPGAYFVTICAWNRECIFGQDTGTRVALTPEGEIVREERLKTPTHRSYVRLDQFVVMPNHFHGVLFLEEEEARHAVPLQEGRWVLSSVLSRPPSQERSAERYGSATTLNTLFETTNL